MLEQLSITPLFQSLPEDIIKEISINSKIQHFNKGDILCYENDDVDLVYYILKGSLKFYKVDRFDNEIFLYKLSRDSLISDLSKACDGDLLHCFANVEFLENSDILAMDSKKFKHLMLTNQEFLKRVLKESFRTIQNLQYVINRDIVYDGAAKVAHMIDIDLETFNILKKHEIAYMLHIQPETLSRILKRLVRVGVIEIVNNKVVIINHEALKNIYS